MKDQEACGRVGEEVSKKKIVKKCVMVCLRWRG